MTTVTVMPACADDCDFFTYQYPAFPIPRIGEYIHFVKHIKDLDKPERSYTVEIPLKVTCVEYDYRMDSVEVICGHRQ